MQIVKVCNESFHALFVPRCCANNNKQTVIRTTQVIDLDRDKLSFNQKRQNAKSVEEFSL